MINGLQLTIDSIKEQDKREFTRKLDRARLLAQQEGKDWLCNHGEPCLCWED